MKYHLIADGPPGYHVNSCKGTARDMRDFIPSELNENKKNSSRNIFTSLQKKKKKKHTHTNRHVLGCEAIECFQGNLQKAWRQDTHAA